MKSKLPHLVRFRRPLCSASEQRQTDRKAATGIVAVWQAADAHAPYGHASASTLAARAGKICVGVASWSHRWSRNRGMFSLRNPGARYETANRNWRVGRI